MDSSSTYEHASSIGVPVSSNQYAWASFDKSLDNHGNRIAYTGTNVIVLVQITRPLKEAHKHIPDAVLFIALGFVFQIIDCNKGSPLYFAGLLVYFKRKCSCRQIESMQIQA